MNWLVDFPIDPLAADWLIEWKMFQPVDFLKERIESGASNSAMEHLYLANCYRSGISVQIDEKKAAKIILQCYLKNRRGRGCHDMTAADLKAWLGAALYDGCLHGRTNAATIVAGLRLVREASQEGSEMAVDYLRQHGKLYTLRDFIWKLRSLDKKSPVSRYQAIYHWCSVHLLDFFCGHRTRSRKGSSAA